MSHTAQKLDALRLNLSGRQVIEASAGTGKTWTLAALYVRLVLAHLRPNAQPLLPSQILVMTFTEAATAELRERIRNRLRDAALWFDHSARGLPMPAGFEADAFLQALRQDYAQPQWPQCALQLSLAADWMDDAAIYTIHAWSRRMLSQHALDSRILFEQTHLDNAAELQLELVQDYWRTWLYPLSQDMLQELLPFLGSSPDHTLEALRTYWREEERKPRAPRPEPAAPQDIGTERLSWKTRCNALAEQSRALWNDALLRDLQDNRIKGAQAKHYANWLEHLCQWVSDANTPPNADLLERFGHSNLHAKAWPKLGAHAAFATQLDVYLSALAAPPDSHSALIEHAATTVAQNYREAKETRGAFDFSDLLQQLYHAVQMEDGRLSQAIRTQYPVALVDEFQDTDPWQYGSLDRIYDASACDASNAFIMIGDPKQAIYSFRGADLNTYLQARADALALDAQSLHTLNTNHRSSQGLVNAVNHVFKQIEAPFSPAQSASSIEFVEVEAAGKVAAFKRRQSAQNPSMTVWQMHDPEGEPVVRVGDYVHHAAHVFADHMAELLNAQDAQPGDMAVLVRGQAHADAMQAALRQRGIPSVYLSDRSSVYAASEATDVWRLLTAMASPNQLANVRAAMACRLWCLQMDELQTLLNDEVQWNHWVEQFHEWHQLWQQRGVLPLLHSFMHTPILGASVAQRLLSSPEGERRLSNLLHLGELLQHASQSLQGIHSVVRFLELQIVQPPQDSDAQKARLETDAQCVQIITYHKSKGLQYPLVFVPFAGSFAYEKKAKAQLYDDDAEASDDSEATSSVDEDMRLLYVALTRAQHALWLGVAETKNDLSKEGKLSALSKLFKRQERGDLQKQLKALRDECPDISVAPMPEVRHILFAHALQAPEPQAALRPTRSHLSAWWTASFSTLTRGLVSLSSQDDKVDDALTDAQALEAPDTDSEQLPAFASTASNLWQSFPAGARYGTLLHDLLEWQSLHQWPAAHINPALTTGWQHTEWHKLLERKAQWLQLPEHHLGQLQAWMTQLLQTPLPLAGLGSDLRLCDVQREQLWAEMEFNIEAHQLSAQRIDQLIQAHVLPQASRPALQERTLNGMLTGFMDLVVAHDGRYWVIDYKSNKLAGYSQAELVRAVLDKRYDVQYVLYTLALHRLLKLRLPNYHYEQHMGGAVYLFLRGIDDIGAGVHALRPPFELIDALDNAFAGVAA